MKKTINRVLIIAFLFIVGIIPIKQVNATTFSNISEKYKDTYVVPYGKEVSIVKSVGDVISSNDTKKAIIKDDKIQVIGTGHFTINVKNNNNTETFNFFAWNAYLIKGKYYVYSDENKQNKSGIIYAKTYLATSKISNTSLKIDDYFYKTGMFKGEGDLKNKYLTNYYNDNTKCSKTNYYKYSFELTFEYKSEPEIKPIYPYKYSAKKHREYKDDTIWVKVENYDKYYVCKIWLRDPAKQVIKKEAGWRKSLKTVNSMLNSASGAIIGCNGSGFLSSSFKANSSSDSGGLIRKYDKNSYYNTTEGYIVISNGQVRRNYGVTNVMLGILPNGSFKYYEKSTYAQVKADGIRDSFTFGPLMLKDGKKYSQKNWKLRKSFSESRKVTWVGQVDENNFIIISSKSGKTATLNQGVKVGQKYECKLLFNFDGGGSSTLWYRGKTSGKGEQLKSSSRSVADALYFKSLK